MNLNRKGFSGIVILMLWAFASHAQDLGFQWGKAIWGFMGLEEHSTTCDKKGNLYFVANYTSINEIWPEGDSLNLKASGTWPDADLGIFKFNRYGQLQWLKVISGPERIQSTDLITDNFGHVYITGSFYGRFDFDPGPDSFFMQNNSLLYADKPSQFILKLTTNGGRFVRASAFRSYDFPDQCYGGSLAIDDQGDVYTTGKFHGRIDFDPGLDTFYNDNTKNAGSLKAYIVKLDSTLQFQWYEELVVPWAMNIALDYSGNILISGEARLKGGDFDPGPAIGKIETPNNGVGYGCFIVKLDNDGKFIWARGLDGDNSRPWDMTCDKDNNVFIVGDYNGEVDFDVGNSELWRKSNPGYDVFILKLDSSGKFEWVSVPGGESSDIAQSIEVNDRGEVYTAGHCNNDFKIGGASFSGKRTEGFIFKLSNKGKPLLVKIISAPGNDILHSMCMNSRGDMYTFLETNKLSNEDSFDLDPGKREYQLPRDPSWQRTYLIQKFSECSDTTGIDSIMACDSFRWINGVTYYADNYTAKTTIASSKGCDSTVTLHLTMHYSNDRTVNRQACDSFEWSDGNVYFKSTDEAFRTLTTHHGCDSVIKLNLKVNYSTQGTDVLTACDSIVWLDGNTYKARNTTATYLLKTWRGCDSLVTLDFDLANNTGVDRVESCDSLQWIDGKTYYGNTNSATHTLVNSAGCDSLVSLNLKIKKSSSRTEQIETCKAYTWINGNTYEESINDVYRLENRAGCDSNIWLHLTILKAQTSTDSVTACSPYQWIDGKSYTQNNNSAQHVLVGSNGCDSIVNLHLTIDNRVSLYPNPSNGWLNIQSETSDINSLKIIGFGGQTVYERQNFSRDNIPLFVNLAAGVYIAEIETPCGFERIRLLFL